ncbi:uncharacterized protein LOC120486562 [Pimephales promelas]|uniref:uncharacterized protein LOC120486562 n=1 Tax=Pimephales promelas TaxID=90988 RepID=UPI001955A11A|nr:uncharacterized protein LOC120486562 [Pimephales promelas]
MKNLVLTFVISLVVHDVSVAETDVVKNVSVIEGDSFTLHTDVTELQRCVLIEWSFGEDVIARISCKSNESNLYVNDRFNDTVKPDNQTGDLEIRKVRFTDFGLYKLVINGAMGVSSKTFNVSGVNNPVSDGVTIVAVLERDSVVLSPGFTEIQRDDQITWRFKGTVIGQLKNQTAEIFADVLDGRFEDRLHLNQQSGSLFITNIRANTSGPYVVDITKSGSGYTTHKTFRVDFIIDEEIRLSVMEGNSVTLQSGVSEIQRDDVITWRSEYGDSVIANMSYRNLTVFDGADGRFRGKLKLDAKTGSLTIRDTRTEHTGLYHLDITSNRSSTFRRFYISVNSQDWSPFIIVVFCVAVLLLVVFIVTCCRNKDSRLIKCDNWRKTEQQCENGGDETENMCIQGMTPLDVKVNQLLPMDEDNSLYSTAHYMSQQFSLSINRMIHADLTEMEDQFSVARRRQIKKLL